MGLIVQCVVASDRYVPVGVLENAEAFHFLAVLPNSLVSLAISMDQDSLAVHLVH